MSNASQKIQAWAHEVENHEFSLWADLPDLDLYMDQVKTYMNKQLSLFKRGSDDKVLTSSMVNNYVKNELLPPPYKKKYNREHISSLMIICMLKQVLAIPDIATMQDGLHSTSSKTLHDEFCTLLKNALTQVCQRVYQAGDRTEDLCELALNLAIEANARRVVAEHILRDISGYDDLV